MKNIILLVGLLAVALQSYSYDLPSPMPHRMQHGFVLSADDAFASHLVAPRHHSWQVEMLGELAIDDSQELQTYTERKSQSAGSTYFVFQAQDLDLASVKAGQVLKGHIIESKLRDYNPKNVVVRSATYRVDKIMLNVPNPFFLD